MPDLRPVTDVLARIAPYPWSHKKDLDGCWSVKDADGWEVCEVNMTRDTGLVNGEAIAGMPDTLAALVAEVERLRAENGKLIVEIENLRSAIFRACEQLSEAADA